jgi:excisionase family DNA binding protein
MTLSASDSPLGNRLLSADDRRMADRLRQILAAQKVGEAHLYLVDPATGERVPISLTPMLSELFIELLGYIANGEAIAILPVQQMLTTQQAADLLNVSRSVLIRLVEKGDIPHTMVGRHRRLKAESVLAYKSARDKARAEAMDALIADSADLY